MKSFLTIGMVIIAMGIIYFIGYQHGKIENMAQSCTLEAIAIPLQSMTLWQLGETNKAMKLSNQCIDSAFITGIRIRKSLFLSHDTRKHLDASLARVMETRVFPYIVFSPSMNLSDEFRIKLKRAEAELKKK